MSKRAFEKFIESGYRDYPDIDKEVNMKQKGESQVSLKSIVEQSGGQLKKTEIDGKECQVIVGSSLVFPAFSLPRRRF